MIKNQVTNPQGKAVDAYIEVFTRGGTKSPELEIWTVGGSRLTPYARRKQGWSMSLSQLFKYIYGGKMADLIPKGAIKLLSCIPKQDYAGAVYHVPIVFGEGNV